MKKVDAAVQIRGTLIEVRDGYRIGVWRKCGSDVSAISDGEALTDLSSA
jgi:hypothetical protein